MTRIDHIGIATGSIEKSSKFWNMLGFEDSGDEIVESLGVKIRYLKGEDATRVELLEPLSEDTPVGQFIIKRGVGVQQIAVSVKNIDEMISRLIGNGIRMINEATVEGSDGHRIAFIHPASTGGVLVELVESH